MASILAKSHLNERLKSGRSRITAHGPYARLQTRQLDSCQWINRAAQRPQLFVFFQ
jgi:hypothetical protein